MGITRPPPYFKYGDKAYESSAHLIGLFPGNLTKERLSCNKRMTSVRTCAAWKFEKISQLLSFTKFEEFLTLYLQPIGLYYRTAVIPTNCPTCLYGTLTSDYLQLQPRTLDDYLGDD